MKILQAIIFLAIIILTTAVVRRIWWIEYKRKNIILSNFIEIATVIGHVIFILILSAIFILSSNIGGHLPFMAINMILAKTLVTY